jgi:catechol 2,3-dioxygenase
VSATEPPTATSPLPPDTGIGAVRLVVGDLDRTSEFYERVIGLDVLGGSIDARRLGPRDGEPLVELVGRPDAPARPRGTTGLFHIAILVPSRSDLAEALSRIGARAPGALTGASDHLVSEAVYLSDPEGNGIEIYHDRPREAWTYVNGDLQMATKPLDVDGVMHSQTGPAGDVVPVDTRMGHVHLQVGDLREAEAFYHGLLGFDVVVRSYPGALFLSAGGYHQHVGLNTWAGAGAPPPPAGSRGLESFEIRLPDRDALQARVDRLLSAGVEVEVEEAGAATRDPSVNGVRLRVAA